MAKLLSNTRVYGTATVDTRLFVNGFIGASSTNSGSLQVSGGIGVSGGGFFGGTVTATNFVGAISGTASLATDLAGGAAGQLLYQIAPNDTGFVNTGTPGQILISQGSNSPLFINTTTFAVGLAVNLLGGSAGQFVYQTGPNATGFINTGSMYVGRAVLADALSTGGISTATNLANGTTGQVPYQTAPGLTSFFGPGTAGQLLVSQGASAAGPAFTNTSSIYVKDSDISTNLRNGSAGQIPYQTGGSATAFVGPGVSGQVLTSGGVSGPVYVNTGSLYVGRAIIADSAAGTDTADKIKTIARLDNSAHYLTFVDSNNAVATGEILYTSSTVAVNPATGAVGLGTSTPSERLELLGAADTARIKITNSTVGRGSLLGQGASGFYWQPTSNSDVFELRNATGTGLFLLNPNTQYVGIGTSGPSERLHVDGAAADTRIRVSATDGTNYRGFEIRAGTTFKGGMLYRTTEGNVMQIWGPTTSNAAMYIDSNNFVGVGTSGPAYNLDVRGSLGAGGGGTNFVVTSDSDAMTRIGTSLAGTGTSRLNIQDRLNWYQSFYVGTVLKARLGVGGSDDLAWEVGGTERVRFTGTGRVGIATTDPQTTLHVNGTARVNSTSEFEARVYMGPLAYERNPANAIQEWGGASSSFSLNIQDGSGRVNYYWNTNGTPSPTQTVANEDSFRLLMGTDGPLIGFYGWDGTSSAAGTAITWTEIIRASMLETNPYFKGTIIPIGSGTTNYVTKFTAAGTIGNSQIFDNGTNVGLATTNPYSRLTLVSESNTTGISLFTSAYIAAREWGTRIWKSDTGGGIPLKFDTQEAGVWYDSISISHGRSNSHPSLRTWNTTQLATDAGNVGIGTTSPLNKLHQAGGKYLLISDDGSYGQLQISAPSGGEATILFGSTGSGQNSGGYTNTGVIGIGAYGNTRDTLVLGTGYSAGTMFLKSGNVGISVVSPNFKLDVSGTGNASSDFRAPIFYDSNNTNFYADPNSTSVFNNLTVQGTKTFTPLSSAYIVVRGTGLNNNANRYVAINNSVVANDTNRGLTLTIINGTNLAHVSSTNYDTYGDTTSSNNLATAITNLTTAQIGILTSYDAWELNVTDNLRAAALKHGLTKLATYRAGGSRRPYAAIFYGTSDETNASTKDAIERTESDDADAPRALITTYLTTDGATAAIDGAHSVNALYSSNSTIEDPIVVVSSDGKVGIGTTNPQSDLVLTGGSYRRFDIIASQQPSIYLDSGGGDIEWYNSYGTVGMLFQSQEQSPNWSTQMIYFNGYGTYATRQLEFLDTKFVVTTTGRAGVNISSPAANLHVNAATPSGIGAVPSGTTGIFDSNTNNYLLFRNSADNNTYSGLGFQDNNIGGYVLFGNAGGAGDLLYVAGYNGGRLQYGTANTMAPGDRTTVASWNSTGLQVNNGDMRASSFVDIDNPAYYLDPNGTSNLNILNGFTVNANIGTGRGSYGAATLNLILNANPGNSSGICGIDFRSGGNYPSDGAQIYYQSATDGGEASRLWIRVENDAADDIYMRAGRIYYDSDTVDGGSQNPGHVFRYDGTDRMYIYSDNVTAPGSFRAPIFYDSDDTTVRWDGNYMVLRGTSPTVYFRDTDHNSAMVHVNSNIFYVLRGGNDTESWSTVNGYWPLEINLTNNNAQFGNNITAIGTITSLSDIKLKENISSIDDSLTKVCQLRGVYYTRKDDELKTRKIGVIAQEVQEVLPEVVMTHTAKEDQEETLSVEYGNIAAVLIEAIKELKQKLEDSNSVIGNLQKEIEELKIKLF